MRRTQWDGLLILGLMFVVGPLITRYSVPDVDAPLELLAILGTLLAMIWGFLTTRECVHDLRLAQSANHHTQMDKLKVIQQAVSSRQAMARGGQRWVGGEEDDDGE